ncbi:folylpolyglutamate synthase/dihydrofolate synthase family protein [soil metagenome]
MDYRAALEYFRDRSDYDRGFISNPFAGDEAAAAGLERTRLLLDALGSPDRAYPIIHVAGTKGKGSTCAFIESTARQLGLRTGMFTTPHLHTVRERIQIDGCPISEEFWSATLQQCSDAVRIVERDRSHLGRITAFELNTAMALLAFSNSSVDLGIIEVGLGGRLDATNVVTPRVSVITPVSYDHQAILGDTLQQIASEKAGIIKPGIPVVVAPQQPEARAEIASRADALGAPVYFAGSDWQRSYAGGYTTIAGPWGDLEDLALGLKGPHQATNAGSAMMALWLLDSNCFEHLHAIAAGLRSVEWPGRYETVQESPPVIVDGAHNGASMAVLSRALLDDYPDHEFVVILGSYADKDLPAMLSELKQLHPTLIATRSSSPRARDLVDILEAAASIDIDGVEQPSVNAAIQASLEAATPRTVMLATGSLSVVAEAREYFGLADVSPVEREILGS